jgi:hypothetical protein
MIYALPTILLAIIATVAGLLYTRKERAASTSTRRR